MKDERQPRIDISQALRRAIDVVNELYKIQGHELADLLLEEVERSGGVWLITLGFARPTTSVGGMLAELTAGAGQPRREYKRVRIDAETGEFLGMQIRELQSQSQQQPR